MGNSDDLLVRVAARDVAWPYDVRVDYKGVDSVDRPSTASAEHKGEVSEVLESRRFCVAFSCLRLNGNRLRVVGWRKVISGDVVAAGEIFYGNGLLILVKLIAGDVEPLLWRVLRFRCPLG